MGGVEYARWLGDSIRGYELFLFIASLFISLSWVASRISNNFSKNIPSENFGHTLNIATGGFFILIIFITLNVWSYVQLAERQAIAETTALINMMKYETHFDSQASEKLIKATKNYIISVRTEEWDSMSKGVLNSSTSQKWNYLNDLILQLNPPATNNNSLYYSQLLQNLDAAFLGRQQRLAAMNSVVPPGLRKGVTAGCLLIVALLGVICRNKRLLPVFIFDVILALNLTVALLLDYPFTGDGTGLSNKIFYSGILEFVPDKYN